MLQHGAAEQLAALHGELFAQFAARELEVALDIDSADAIRSALVDHERHGDLVAVAIDPGVLDLDAQIAVVIVIRGQPIDVFLKPLLIERAPSGDPTQQAAVSLGRDRRAQLSR